MCADCNEYEAVPVSNDDPAPVVDCTMCKHYLPCQKASKKTDDVACEKFENLYTEDADMPSLEALQAINASIPDDVIEPDYTGIDIVE